MMAFPASPTNNQTYTSPTGVSYSYTNGAWNVVAGLSTVKQVLEFTNFAAFPATGAIETVYLDKSANRIYRWSTTASAYQLQSVKVTTSVTPPVNPNIGDIWFDSTNIVLFIRINDSVSDLWLDISSVGGGGGSVGAKVTTSTTPPVGSKVGDLWFDSAKTILYVRINDTVSDLWFDVSSGTGSSVVSVAGKAGVVTLTSTDVGLGNVDNTSDTNKPISTATQASIYGRVKKGVNTIGYSRAKGGQAVSNFGSGLTAGVSTSKGFVGKREMECTSQTGEVRVRCHIFSREQTNISRNWQVAIAPTETADISSANNYFQPIVGGTVRNVVASNTASTGDQYGYIQMTFGGARKSGELYPAGLANRRTANRISNGYCLVSGVVTSDWAVMPIVPRTDVSPNGITKSMHIYRISFEGNASDTFSSYSASFVGNTGYQHITEEYIQWLAGDPSARFDLCSGVTLAADFDVTNDFTKVPPTTSPLTANNTQSPIILWEYDYGTCGSRVENILMVGDSQTEGKKPDMQFTAKFGDGSGATPTTTDSATGTIMTVSSLGNSSTKLLAVGNRVYATGVKLETYITAQLTSTEAGNVLGGTGTYSINLAPTSPVASQTAYSMINLFSPKLWWKSAINKRSIGTTIIDSANFGMSTNRSEMFTEALLNLLRRGFRPTIVVFPDTSTNNYSPVTNTRMWDWRQQARYNEELAVTLQSLGIKLIMWTVVNFAATGTNTTNYENITGRQYLLAHTRSMAARGLCELVDIQLAFDRTTGYVDGVHANAAEMVRQENLFGAVLDKILAGE